MMETDMMTIQLPEPITAYFAADRLDGDAVARCFTSDAVVKDEGRTYTGVAAIKQWKAETAAKYTYTCEPLSRRAEGRNDRGDVPSGRQFSGWPGRPALLLPAGAREDRQSGDHPVSFDLRSNRPSRARHRRHQGRRRCGCGSSARCGCKRNGDRALSAGRRDRRRALHRRRSRDGRGMYCRGRSPFCSSRAGSTS